MKHRDLLRIVAVCGGIGLSAAAFSVSAQTATSMLVGQTTRAAPGAAESSAATAAFKAGGKKMMKDMSAPYSGDVDNDFVSHMIPHHQGAVSMAEVELKYGKDPKMRKLAQDIIKAQDQEIATMKAWQAKHEAK